MFKRSLVLLVVLLALVAVPVSAQGPTVARLATVGVDDVTVSVGETFAVPVWINGVSDLYGADVRLYYDNAILQGISVERGTLLTPGFVVAANQSGMPIVLMPGTIALNCTASNTGVVDWYVEFEPMAPGALVAAA